MVAGNQKATIDLRSRYLCLAFPALSFSPQTDLRIPFVLFPQRQIDIYRKWMYLYVI